MEPSFNHISKLLSSNVKVLANKTVLAGFDGFVDSVIRVVKTKQEGRTPSYFRSIKEFGEYIIEKAGGSFSLETDELFQKLGGNMPILANSLANFGVTVNCIGAFGESPMHPAFSSMHPNCNRFSFTSPGITSALEFGDGKILLGQMKELNLADWDLIKRKVGIEQITKMFIESDLVCLVNWGELDKSTEIWKGFLSEVIPRIANDRAKKVFFDLSDCSKRSREAVQEALSLIERFNKNAEVTLSLNKNETQQVYSSILGSNSLEDIEKMGSSIYQKLGINNLIIHTSKESYGWDRSSFYSSSSYSIKEPKVMTGAGDNFNAGVCLGLLLDLPLLDSLTIGNTIAACYIAGGISPTIAELLNNAGRVKR